MFLKERHLDIKIKVFIDALILFVKFFASLLTALFIFVSQATVKQKSSHTLFWTLNEG